MVLISFPLYILFAKSDAYLAYFPFFLHYHFNRLIDILNQKSELKHIVRCLHNVSDKENICWCVYCLVTVRNFGTVSSSMYVPHLSEHPQLLFAGTQLVANKELASPSSRIMLSPYCCKASANSLPSSIANLHSCHSSYILVYYYYLRCSSLSTHGIYRVSFSC